MGGRKGGSVNGIHRPQKPMSMTVVLKISVGPQSLNKAQYRPAAKQVVNLFDGCTVSWGFGCI